jgi:predicted RNase H-like HicB family nuclease
MAKFTAMVEQAVDGSWTASIIGEHTILGTGANKEEALADLRRGVAGLVDYLKLKGEPPLPEYAIELVSIEVAA